MSNDGRPDVATLHRVLRGLGERVREENSELAPSMGERNSAAKMTEEKVKALRASHDAGVGISAIADAFEIDVRTARHIVQRTSWRHV